MLVLFGVREVGCFREVAALHTDSDHLRQVLHMYVHTYVCVCVCVHVCVCVVRACTRACGVCVWCVCVWCVCVNVCTYVAGVSTIALSSEVLWVCRVCNQ